MAFSDRTGDFRAAIKECQQALPDAKRRRLSKSPSNEGKEYLAEAYVVLNHITTLARMLATIRKPYLNMDSRAPLSSLSRQASRTLDLASSDSFWVGIQYLTNEERDQIDMQARVILSRCADRVKEMEVLEKRRIELVARQTNPLTRFLPARLRQDESTVLSDFIAAHRSSITWYLNRRLAETSQGQKELQEERVKRQLERTRTLGSGAAREALSMGIGQPPMLDVRGDTGKGGWLGEASSNLISGLNATIGASSPRETSTLPKPIDQASSSDDEDEEIELSQSQILQFEAENAQILRSVEDSLQSIQLAESRLLDISALQMELVTHLTKQTELTDQLYEDAIATTSMVEKGNVQLREAKRRAKDGRVFILVFLVGASLSLLFLHYY